MRIARPAAEGYVLAATLWIVVAVAVLAAYIDGVVASDVGRAITAKRSLQSELDRRSTEATLIYLFVTGRMSGRGLILDPQQRFSDSRSEDARLPNHGDDELGVTGRVYAGVGRTRFSVQDEGGLVSVNSPGSPLFTALLEHIGVAASDIERMVVRVEDYIDKDSNVTLNGAEQSDYRRRGAPPPLNWTMSSPVELKKVLGFDEMLTPTQWHRLRPLLTVRPVFGYNFNTMRPEVLAAVLGLEEQDVQSLLAEREKRSIYRLTTISLLSGRHPDIDEMEIRTLPSRFLRLSLWREGAGSRTIAGIALTPLGESAPWRKDYRYSEPISAQHDSRTPREPPLTVAKALFQ